MAPKQDPAIGDKVQLKNGNLGEVIGFGSMVTNQGFAIMYNIKFLEGPIPGSSNLLREEFTFPVKDSMR